jgi:hypothetical protein
VRHACWQPPASPLTPSISCSTRRACAAPRQLIDRPGWCPHPSWYKREVADKLMEAAPHKQHPPFGFLGVMAFPAAFARSFGALGSPRWRRWSGELQALQVPARCCFFHLVSLTHGARPVQHEGGAYAAVTR